MNRPATEAFIKKYIEALLPDSGNVALYESLFKSMNDEEFAKWIEDLETEKKFLTIVAPNYFKSKLSIERNMKIAEELGHSFFQQLWIGNNEGMPEYLTPIEYLVVDLPLRRTAQRLVKKISVPDDNKTVDTLTGQPTGKSKGAGISYPEVQICAAMGLENSMVELMKYKGGDNKGGSALNNMLAKYGKANLDTLSNFSSGVESTKSLKTFMTAMHLRSTL